MNDSTTTPNDDTLDALQRNLDAAIADPEFTGVTTTAGDGGEGTRDGAPRVDVRDLVATSEPTIVELDRIKTTLTFAYDQETVRVESTNPYLGLQWRRVVTADGPGELWPISFAC